MVRTAPSVFVSAASIWELAIKAAAGRLRFPIDHIEEILAEAELDILDIMPRHAIVAGGLPKHHSDPFDRMLIAQAQTERLTLVSGDTVMRRYDVALL